MIDMMFVSGVFEQPARVLFLDDGVRQLASGQDASLVDRKDTAKALGALPAYDVDELFAHAESLAARGIDPEDMAVDAKVVEDDEVAALLHAIRLARWREYAQVLLAANELLIID